MSCIMLRVRPTALLKVISERRNIGGWRGLEIIAAKQLLDAVKLFLEDLLGAGIGCRIHHLLDETVVVSPLDAELLRPIGIE